MAFRALSSASRSASVEARSRGFEGRRGAGHDDRARHGMHDERLHFRGQIALLHVPLLQTKLDVDVNAALAEKRAIDDARRPRQHQLQPEPGGMTIVVSSANLTNRYCYEGRSHSCSRGEIYPLRRSRTRLNFVYRAERRSVTMIDSAEARVNYSLSGGR